MTKLQINELLENAYRGAIFRLYRANFWSK